MCRCDLQLMEDEKQSYLKSNAPKAQPRIDNALLKALAKAHRWRRQIENGEYASITELAKAQRVNDSYACRLLRLTLLAPQIVIEILNGGANQPSMSRLTNPFPVEWHTQLSTFRLRDLDRVTAQL